MHKSDNEDLLEVLAGLAVAGIFLLFALFFTGLALGVPIAVIYATGGLSWWLALIVPGGAVYEVFVLRTMFRSRGALYWGLFRMRI